jgi:hypothetical protein
MQNCQDAARLLYEEVFGVFGALKEPRQRADGLCGVTTPKPSECRTCHIAFPSRSRLHEHLRASGHTERRCRGYRSQPVSEIIETGSTTNKAICKRYCEAFGFEPGGFTGTNVHSTAIRPGTTPAASLGPEETTPSHFSRPKPRHGFFGITISSTATKAPATTPSEAILSLDSSPIEEAKGLDRFGDDTGYEGVTFKERGYPRSPVSDRASLRSSFTTVPAAFSLSLRFSSTLRETSAARKQHLRKVRRKLIHWQAHPSKFKR